MMSGEAQLEALLDIINTSARKAIAEYKKGGSDVPTIHSKEYHPIDFAADSLALKKEVRLLEGACQQLCASLAPPQHTMMNFTMPFEWACVGVVLRAKVADVLEIYPKGLHVNELSKMVELEKGKLTRILRLLAIKGCFTEVSPETFANNRISLVTHSNSNPSAVLRIMAEDSARGATLLYETLTDSESAASYDPRKAPVIYALKKNGFEGNYFDWIKYDAGRLENFHRAMIGMNHITGSGSVLLYYPWNEVKTVCDVGSGTGAISLPLAKMFPHLKIVDQDLPEVLAQAMEVWTKVAPEVVQKDRVKFLPLNFLEECPVHDQDLYYLRYIIHGWPDTEAAIIMRNIRKAMAPHSRLLIHDYVLTSAIRDSDARSLSADVAPEPMLPNFGNGSNRMFQQDMAMLLLRNAKERTLDDLIELGSAAGLRLEKVYDLAETAVLDFRVAA